MREVLDIRAASGPHPGANQCTGECDFATAIAPDMALLLTACGARSPPGGDMAAKIAVERVLGRCMDALGEYAPVDFATPRHVLFDALRLADLTVRKKKDIEDAVADVLAAIVLPERVWIGRAGTACAFRLRAGRMLCLDKLGPVAHPRPLGHPRAMGIDVRAAPLVAGDALVLSTAGLIAAAPEAEIAAILGAHTDVNAAVGALLSIARDLGWPCFAVVAARVGAE